MKKKLFTTRVISFIKRNYSTDRNYSTAVGVIPEYEEELFSESTDVGLQVKPYSEIPGPKELPIIGNAWRFAPIIGKVERNKSIYLLQAQFFLGFL